MGIANVARWIIAMLLCAGIESAAAETAREYYEELLSVKGLNPIATFVCFPDDENEGFAIVARSSEFEATLKRKGLPVSKELQSSLRNEKSEFLYWQTFHKGVLGAVWDLERGSSSSEWSMKFDKAGGKKTEGEIRVNITWPTLRYKLVVTMRDAKGAATMNVYGRCEPIPG
jgi:hypothetical protein